MDKKAPALPFFVLLSFAVPPSWSGCLTHFPMLWSAEINTSKSTTGMQLTMCDGPLGHGAGDKRWFCPPRRHACHAAPTSWLQTADFLSLISSTLTCMWSILQREWSSHCRVVEIEEVDLSHIQDFFLAIFYACVFRVAKLPSCSDWPHS